MENIFICVVAESRALFAALWAFLVMFSREFYWKICCLSGSSLEAEVSFYLYSGSGNNTNFGLF